MFYMPWWLNWKYFRRYEETFIATKPRNNLHFDFLPMLKWVLTSERKQCTRAKSIRIHISRSVLSIGLDRTTLKVAGNQHAFCWKSYRCCVQKGVCRVQGESFEILHPYWKFKEETERNDDSIAISGLRWCEKAWYFYTGITIIHIVFLCSVKSQTTTKSSAMTEEKICSKAQKDIKGGSSFYKAIIPDFDRRRKLEIRLFAQYNILQTMPYIRLRRSQVLRPLLCLSIVLQNSRLRWDNLDLVRHQHRWSPWSRSACFVICNIARDFTSRFPAPPSNTDNTRSWCPTLPRSLSQRG